MNNQPEQEMFRPYMVCLIVDVPGLGKANEIVMAENSPNGRVNLLNEDGKIAKTNAIKGVHFLRM